MNQSLPRTMPQDDRHAEELAILYEISKTLATGTAMEPMIAHVLAVLHARLHLDHGMLVLHDPQTNELAIEVAHGLTEEERARGRYQIGEGVTGAVYKAGKPLLIADLAKEPRFLNRSVRRNLSGRTVALLAVPVRLYEGTVGVLSVDREGGVAPADLERDLQFLTVVASLIAQVVRVRKVLTSPLPARPNPLDALSGIIGDSKVMRQLFDVIRRVSGSRAILLLRGESGTGKDLLARTIHELSPRRHRPFVAVHCASLPETLLESELFGHERGAFTGAVSRRLGRFELADGGTLFLDEVGDIPLSVQAKLLRAVQGLGFERLGGQQTIRTDARLLAATHRPLEEMVRQGTFREDLYYRLNVVPVMIPPLRERREDIPLLVDHFLARFNREHGKHVSISSDALSLLTDYHWPGNVRELEHCLERLVLLTVRPVITPEEIDALAHLLDLPKEPAVPAFAPPPSLPRSVQELERTELVAALERTGWVKARAAKRLGLTPRQLSYRVKKYGLKPPEGWA
ncbi:MAG TPA: sigma 54-interacting transcriptional regulator [Nitrospiria bacterium]|nr:sigma 54-interacting transcriptional regulator [Nitrospiria bacterium]